MIPPRKPPKPYSLVSTDNVSPLVNDKSNNIQDCNSDKKASSNPFDDDDDEEILLMESGPRNTNPFGVATQEAIYSPKATSSKKPALNSFDSVHIVANPSTKKKSSKKSRSHNSSVDSNSNNSSKSTDSSGKDRTSESRANFLRKVRNMETKLNKRSNKEGEGSTVFAIDNEDENAVIRFLVSDRVYGYPGTNGTILSNYRHFVYNNHPLLSMLWMHPKHPFDRRKRAIVFILTLVFTIFVSFLLLKTDVVEEIAMCRSGCSQQISNSTTTAATANNATICVGGYNDGVEYDDYDRHCRYYHPWMLSAVCGAVTVLYGSLIRFAATCDCMQGRDFFQSTYCGAQCKGLVSYLGGFVLTLFSLLSVFLIVWTVVQCYLTNIGFAIFSTLLLSKLWSFAEWFLWSSPYFSYRYPPDKRHFYSRLGGNTSSSSNSNV